MNDSTTATRVKFQDPPKRRTDDHVEVLSHLLNHPGRWALVAECITVNARQTWHGARRRVGGDGEFTFRQVQTAGTPGFIDLYARYDEQVSS